MERLFDFKILIKFCYYFYYDTLIFFKIHQSRLNISCVLKFTSLFKLFVYIVCCEVEAKQNLIIGLLFTGKMFKSGAMKLVKEVSLPQIIFVYTCTGKCSMSLFRSPESLR